MHFFGRGGDDDDDDVEVALVCPTQTLDGLNDLKQFDKKDVKKPKSVFQRFQKGLVSETAQCLGSLVVLLIVLGSVVVAYFFCPVCLFGIMVVSACLCPFLPYFNIPLWTSIVLIVVLGMTYTHRPFTLIWK